MFSKETYVNRRNELKRLVKSGVIILFGNNESPANYPANTYFPFRQDSSFLYYFGQHRDGLVGVIDIDNNIDTLIGNNIDIEDIVWYGSVESIADMAERVGAQPQPMAALRTVCQDALRNHRTIHFLPPYRHDTMITIMDLLGIHPNQQREQASLPLIKAVVQLRSVKSAGEIEELERAARIGYEMHTTAMRLCRPGVTEQYIGGMLDGIASAYGCITSFQSIVSMHGEILHGYPSPRPLEAGRLLLCDAGAETNHNYCSDHTRTTPISGKFTQKQKEIYQIVVDCHDLALTHAKPGVRWWDVHMAVCTLMTERLKELGLMKGDTQEAVQAGAHALFLPHGLGHMMGMDVHDMEGLGQNYVGYDDTIQPSDQFGLASLRFARKLEPGHVITDEPGIYFIPDLIDDWAKSGKYDHFIDFNKVNEYRDFGGVRIEDDVLITPDGCRFLGDDRVPYKAADVEDYIAQYK